MSRDTVKYNKAEAIRIMKSPAVQKALLYQAQRARLRAQAASDIDLHFGCGVEVGSRRVSAHSWVGANNLIPSTGRPNAGLHKKQVEALKQALHGI